MKDNVAIFNGFAERQIKVLFVVKEDAIILCGESNIVSHVCMCITNVFLNTTANMNLRKIF